MVARKNSIPRHLSFVLDGNRRWAKEKGLPAWEGHLAALTAIENLVLWSRDAKISYLSLYLFSTENWSRSEEELANLLGGVAEHAISAKFPALLKMGAKINVYGSLDRFPAPVRMGIEKLVVDSADNKSIVVNLCLNYGSRAEIVEAVKQIATEGIDAHDISEQVISDRLYSAGVPEPDMMIRTGGAQRLSNFLLWQHAYSELYFVDKYLPEFSKADFDEALEWYAGQERRYGQ